MRIVFNICYLYVAIWKLVQKSISVAFVAMVTWIYGSLRVLSALFSRIDIITLTGTEGNLSILMRSVFREAHAGFCLLIADINSVRGTKSGLKTTDSNFYYGLNSANVE